MEAFAIRAGFVVPAPRLAMEFRGRVARVTIAMALLLLTGYGAPRLIVHAHTNTAAPAAETKAPFDVDSVVERASHTITRTSSETGALEVRDAGYRARFDQTGFSYAPTHATTALAVSLTHIARGQHSLLTNVGAWSSSGNLARRTLSDGVREQVTSTEGALEWDVVLAKPPAGTGPLTINANLDGVVGTPARVDGNTAWRLGLAGGAHVTLGETIVKDATGAELYRALPVVTVGNIALVVPDAVLTTAAYPVTIDPKVSAPVTVNNGQDNTPAVASDGTNYLVVWSQPVGSPGDFNIYGARVSGDGTFVQPVGQISPTNAGHGSSTPDVAWNGSSYLVVYQYNYSSGDVDIRGQRIAATGALIGTTIFISQASDYQTDAAVTAAGSTFYVVWQDSRAGNYDIYGGRVNSSGARLDVDGIKVVDDARDELHPDVAWNGSNFLVVFDFVYSATDTDVQAHPVNSSAVAIGSRQIIKDAGVVEEHPAVSSHGTEFFATWEDSRNLATTGIDIYGARLAALGTTITGDIAISKNAGDQDDPAIAFNGTYLVVWTDERNSRDIYADRVTTNGAVQDGNGFVVETADNPLTPAVTRGPGTKWAVDYGTYTSSTATSHIVHRTIAPK